MRLMIAAAVLSIVAVGAAQGVDIGECGQTVPAGQVGVLVADLDCPSTPGVCAVDPLLPCSESEPCPSGGCLFPNAVTLANGATLHLNGHTVAGGLFAIAPRDSGPITIVGPGSVVGAVLFRKRLTISDVAVSAGHFGVYSGVLGRLDATNLTVTGTAGIGIRAGMLRGGNIVSNGNATAGIECVKLKADDVTANDNGEDGIRCTKIKSTTLTTNDNGGAGVQSTKNSNLVAFAASGNGGPGYFSFSGGGRLTDATLEGNDLPGPNDDIVTKRRPRLRGSSTCAGSSARFSPTSPSGGIRFDTWRVCALD